MRCRTLERSMQPSLASVAQSWVQGSSAGCAGLLPMCLRLHFMRCGRLGRASPKGVPQHAVVTGTCAQPGVQWSSAGCAGLLPMWVQCSALRVLQQAGASVAERWIAASSRHWHLCAALCAAELGRLCGSVALGRSGHTRPFPGPSQQGLIAYIGANGIISVYNCKPGWSLHSSQQPRCSSYSSRGGSTSRTICRPMSCAHTHTCLKAGRVSTPACASSFS